MTHKAAPRSRSRRYLLPSWDETPRPGRLTFQECSSRAEWFRREAAYVDFDLIDIDLNHDHIGVREAWRKMRIHVARPHGSHLCDILDNRNAAAQGDVAVAGRMLKCEGDQRRGSHLADFAGASANEGTPGPFIGPGRPSRGADRP
jgi:hypothetical protein